MTTKVERWTNAAPQYDVPHLRLRQVASVVNKLAPRRMVDLGCATGHLRKLCPGVEYLGCDFTLPETAGDFPFRQCDFNRDPLPPEVEGADVVVCCGILEYIEELPDFLARVRGRLASGGLFVATYFNMNHLSRIRTLLRGGNFPVHPDWRGFYSPRGLALLLENAGFEITETFVTGHSLRPSTDTKSTVGAPLALPRAHRWSHLFAHQFIYVARRAPDKI